MNAVTLSDLGPILAAVLGPMLLFVVASMRYQHIDSTKTRERIAESIAGSNKENRRLIAESNKENRRLIEKSNQETRRLIDRNYDLIMKNYNLIIKSQAGLSDMRERLARMEGYLRSSPPPEHGADGGGNDAEAA